MKKCGRNDPCPCGSGKKYKKCCGQKKSLAQRSISQLTAQKGGSLSSVQQKTMRVSTNQHPDQLASLKERVTKDAP